MRAAKPPLILAGILMLSGLGLAGYQWTQSPATGINTTQRPVSNTSVLGSQTKLTTFTTSYFSTQLPTQLAVKSKQENPTAAIRGSYLFTSGLRTRSDQPAITYGTLGNNQLGEIAAVKLRLNHPEQYAPATIAALPAGSLAFSATDGYETSVFWQHGNQYVAVVASGTADARADMDEALHAAISNWQWQ